ncbi:cytosine permease [Oceanobacillus jeddahense]|uniref:cytosine permease n=1 Tax=Oceanobacillus jeddahense TaxID=1462527 RepID=UPI00059592BE|nr:cytosine permease [Oceanobacillus jeddahense]
MTSSNSSSDYDLLSPDLAPIEAKDRNVSVSGLGIIWFGMAVQITVLAALAQMTNYFTIGELLMIYTIGSILLAFLTLVAQDIGLKYGISFATSIVASFGYKGGKIVSVIRVVPSLIWFAVNGYIGAQAINEVFKIIFSFDNIYISLAINIAALVFVTIKGVKGIERFTTIIVPLLLVVGIYMLYIVLASYNIPFNEILNMGKTGDINRSWIFGFAVIVGLFSSVVMGMNDITKNGKVKNTEKGWLKTNRRYFIASLIGIVPALVFFCILGNITVVLSGRIDVLVVISELIQERSIILAVLVQLFIVTAQLSTNTAANLLPSAYIACSLIPKRLNFKVATITVAILACALQPWNYLDRLDLIVSLFSTTAGPAMAIIAVDYYLFRKRQLSLDDLFKSKGKYNYYKGFNPAALIVYIIATLIGFFFFLDVSFFISTALAIVLYYPTAKVFGKKFPIIIHEETKAFPNESDSKVQTF